MQIFGLRSILKSIVTCLHFNTHFLKLAIYFMKWQSYVDMMVVTQKFILPPPLSQSEHSKSFQNIPAPCIFWMAPNVRRYPKETLIYNNKPTFPFLLTVRYTHVLTYLFGISAYVLEVSSSFFFGPIGGVKMQKSLIHIFLKRKLLSLYKDIF